MIPIIIGINTATVPELLSPADIIVDKIIIAIIIWRSVFAYLVTIEAILSHTPVSNRALPTITTPINIRIVVLANPLTASFGVTSPVSTRAHSVSITVILTGIFSSRKDITARIKIIIVSVDGSIFPPHFFSLQRIRPPWPASVLCFF